MSDEPPSSSPGSPGYSRVLRLSSVDEGNALFAKWRGRFEQLSSGPFESTLRVVNLGALRLTEIEVNQRVRSCGQDVAGVFSAHLVTEANAGSVWQGRRLEPGQIVATGVETGVDHFTARRSRHLGLFLSPDLLSDAARTLLQTDDVLIPRTWASSTPRPENFTGLTRAISRLLQAGATTPELLSTAEGRHLEQETIRWLAESLFASGDLRAGVPHTVRRRIVRGAEEYMRSHLAGTVSTLDLCRVAGTSGRTLRLAFREQFGLGPMTYYRYLRLNAVRDQLRAPATASIAEIARSMGFHHLGNFAADYRRLFGERPSQTARRG